MHFGSSIISQNHPKRLVSNTTARVCHLTRYLKVEGLCSLIALVDPGALHLPKFTGPKVKNTREWCEFFRRL
jgi:hypothetical protein